jgi:hypothetical protein
MLRMYVAASQSLYTNTERSKSPLEAGIHCMPLGLAVVVLTGGMRCMFGYVDCHS